jgi:large conductance mechanosensitive channel
MREALNEFVRRSDLVVVTAGLALALAIVSLVQVVVSGLIAPFIAVFIGEQPFELNSFTIESSQFGYGYVIEAALVLAIVGVAAQLLLRHRNDGGAASTRPCPECTTPIPAAAKRCPNCTAVVSPGST